MGYRSNVCLAVSRNGLTDLCNFIPESMSQIMSSADSFIQKGNDYCFRWNNVKWYENDDRPHFKALAEAMRDLEDEDYHFIRIGENRDDNEERGCYYTNSFSTNLVRKIELSDDGSRLADLTTFL